MVGRQVEEDISEYRAGGKECLSLEKGVEKYPQSA